MGLARALVPPSLACCRPHGAIAPPASFKGIDGGRGRVGGGDLPDCHPLKSRRRAGRRVERHAAGGPREKGRCAPALILAGGRPGRCERRGLHDVPSTLDLDAAPRTESRAWKGAPPAHVLGGLPGARWAVGGGIA